MERPDVGVYYFPQYHPDPRNDEWHGKGWTEWELVRRSEARFPGHLQPKVPLWGYYDESDPVAAARSIRAARDHGIDFFIFDWYYYEDGPFLNGCLERGFLQAENADDFRFAVMWANHPWRNWFPFKRIEEPTLLMSGVVSPAAFTRATDYVIERYFSLDNYYRLGDSLYYSLFDLWTLIESFGGVEQTAEALVDFRERARRAGVGELHLNGVLWSLDLDFILRFPEMRSITPEASRQLGLDSVTSYNWTMYEEIPEFVCSYGPYAEKAAQGWEKFAKAYPLPYIPGVTMGWDSSPRTAQSEEYLPVGYPYTPVLVDNTPELFGRAVGWCRDYLRSSNALPLMTLYAWNEWTEGSYLEPDEVYGFGHLEALAAALR